MTIFDVWRDPVCPICSGAVEQIQWNDEQGQHLANKCLICSTLSKHSVSWTSTGTGYSYTFKGVPVPDETNETEGVTENSVAGDIDGAKTRNGRLIFAETELKIGNALSAFSMLYGDGDFGEGFFTFEEAMELIRLQLRMMGK